MSWDKGFNFRATSGYVTDGADETYVLAEVYPVTRNGVTFGWESSGITDSRDRSTAIDRRLAGINVNTNTFRVDLPAAGDYEIRVAAGDGYQDSSTYDGIHTDLQDDSTVLASLNQSEILLGSFCDAANSVHTAANWPGSNQAISKTFSTDVFRLNQKTAPSNNRIAHLFLSQATTPPVSSHVFPRIRRTRTLLRM